MPQVDNAVKARRYPGPFARRAVRKSAVDGVEM